MRIYRDRVAQQHRSMGVTNEGWTISNCCYHTFWTIVKRNGNSKRRGTRVEKLLRIRIFRCIVSRRAWADSVADTLRSAGRVSANEHRAVRLFHNKQRATHLALPTESKSSHSGDDRAVKLGRPRCPGNHSNPRHHAFLYETVWAHFSPPPPPQPQLFSGEGEW